MGRRIHRGFWPLVVLGLFAAVASSSIAVSDAEAAPGERPALKALAARTPPEISTKDYPWVWAIGIRQAHVQQAAPGIWGVSALSVEINSPAARAGILPNTTVTWVLDPGAPSDDVVHGKRILSLADLNSALAAMAGRSAPVLLLPDPAGGPLEVPATP
jgi:hypothetical protein